MSLSLSVNLGDRTKQTRLLFKVARNFTLSVKGPITVTTTVTPPVVAEFLVCDWCDVDIRCAG